MFPLYPGLRDDHRHGTPAAQFLTRSVGSVVNSSRRARSLKLDRSDEPVTLNLRAGTASTGMYASRRIDRPVTALPAFERLLRLLALALDQECVGLARFACLVVPTTSVLRCLPLWIRYRRSELTLQSSFQPACVRSRSAMDRS
jgi:hypothetical protein